jgi:hypothetical protein
MSGSYARPCAGSRGNERPKSTITRAPRAWREFPERRRNDLLKKKSTAARKATRETFRAFSRLSGVDSDAAALLTIAWAMLMDGSFEGDGR